MRACLILVLAVMMCAEPAFAQLHVVKPVPKKRAYHVSRLGVGFGRSQSVLFLMRNIKENNDAKGWNVNAAYNLDRVHRISAEYIWFRPIDIAPTWFGVRGRTLEMNLSWLFTFPNGKMRFYPIAGICHNVFEGYFTGDYDHLNLRSLYTPNTVVRTVWLGVNGGCGMEVYLKPISVFGDFRMRIGVSDSNQQLTIMDVCLSAGVRYNLRVPSLQSLYKGTRSRYLLKVQEEED